MTEPAKTIRVLLIDDDVVQNFLIQGYLTPDPQENFDLKYASCLAEGIQTLARNETDVVLLDLGLPDSPGDQTFDRVRRQFPALPIVVLTGLEDESVGLQLVLAGAQDYLVKCQINGPLVRRALRYAIERNRLANEIKQAMAEIKTLSGLLPICAGCKKVRDDKGYWTQIESYIQKHSQASFSHGLCPECIPKYFPDVDLEANNPKEPGQA
jgi:DNA-binding NarL/FixJ family response regulator